MDADAHLQTGSGIYHLKLYWERLQIPWIMDIAYYEAFLCVKHINSYLKMNYDYKTCQKHIYLQVTHVT